MKILLISLRSDLSGGPKHMAALLKELKQIAKKDQFYCATPVEPPFGDVFQNLSRGFFELPVRSFSIIKYFQLALWVRKHGITHIHSHGRGAGIYSRLLRLFGLKVIHTFHGVHTQDDWPGKVKLAIEQLLRPFTNCFINVSYGEKVRAIEYEVGQENAVIVHNGVDINEINKNMLTIANDKGKKIVLITIARLEPVKNIKNLLDKTRTLKLKGMENLVLNIIGDGPLRAELEQYSRSLQLEEQVTFLGKIDNPIPYLQKADIFISNSLMEGMPYSVLEAMACKLPCILSDIKGHEDLLIPGETGLFFDLEDVDSFVDAVKRLSENSELCAKMGDRAYAVVTTQFTQKEMAEKTLNIYHSV